MPMAGLATGSRTTVEVSVCGQPVLSNSVFLERRCLWEIEIVIFLTCFWLSTRGQPVLVWKQMSGFPNASGDVWVPLLETVAVVFRIDAVEPSRNSDKETLA